MKHDVLTTMAPGFTYDQALAEANRCLLCHEPPCSKGCPAQTDPGTFIRQFRLRNVTGAIRTIKENNILGGACGVLCPTARLCEKECSACGIDKPVRIGKIQRFLVEHAKEIGFQPFANPRYDKPAARKEKVAVVGGGPAGLSCAAELARHGFPVTVFEKRPEVGGVLRYGVPSFRFSTEFLKREIADLQALGVEIKCDEPVEKEGAVEKLLSKGFKAVFVGVGLWAPTTLHDQPQSGDDLFSSIEFLETFRKDHGKTLGKHCKGKTVAVIGGGSVAIDCARTALKLGATDVYLVYRRSYAQMPAEADERSEALEEGIHFVLLNQPVEYVRKNDGRLAALEMVRTRLGDEDASGRRKPVEIPDSRWRLEVDTVIEAIGNQAVSDSPTWYPTAKVNKHKLLKVDDQTGRTSVAHLYAGGDIARGPATVVEAIADGKRAAHDIMASFAKEN